MLPIEAKNSLEQRLIERASVTKTPINGSIELLPLCNMNCEMCYVRLSREEMEEKGRLRTVEEWMEIGRQMKEAGVLFLLLTGGEPLLYPGFKELYLGLHQMGMILTINTNGTLIDEEMAQFFGEHRPRRINITLYGASEQAYESLCHYPGGFQKVIRAVQLLKAQGVDVKLGGSVTKQNVQDIPQMIEIGRRLEVPVRMDTYMMPAVRERQKPYQYQSRLEPEEAAFARVQSLFWEMGPHIFVQYVEQSIQRVEEAIRKLEQGEEEQACGKVSCLAGNCSFTINWQGEMHACVILTEPASPVFEVGFEKAWQEIVQQVAEIALSKECNGCPYKLLCRTCAASALVETGAFDGIPEYMCRYAKETFRLLKEARKQFEQRISDR